MILYFENSSHANSSYLNFVVVEILFICLQKVLQLIEDVRTITNIY